MSCPHPPPVEKQQQQQPPPPTYPSTRKKSIAEMTPEERLASMRAFAEDQKYIQPGGGEILPYNSSRNDGGFNSVIFGNPYQGPSSFKMATDGYGAKNLPPPLYEDALRLQKEEEERKAKGEKRERSGSLRKFFRRHSKAEEDKEGSVER